MNNERGIAQFAAIVNKVLDNICPLVALKLLNYGCFCGLQETWPPLYNKTMDSFDSLCLEHDWCWHQVNHAGCSSYWEWYSYYFIEEMVWIPSKSRFYNKISVRIIIYWIVSTKLRINIDI